MASYSSLPVAGKVRFARKALTNARNIEPIAVLMAKRGYDEVKIDEGLTLLGDLEAFIALQPVDLGAQKAATQEVNVDRKEAKRIYSIMREDAKYVFRNDVQALTELLLDKSIPTTDAAWEAQASQFYTNLLGNPDRLGAMIGFGTTEDDIRAGEALLPRIQEGVQQQGVAKGAKENRSQQRAAALEALDAYMKEFIRVARIALRDAPQYLETLGISVAS